MIHTGKRKKVTEIVTENLPFNSGIEITRSDERRSQGSVNRSKFKLRLLVLQLLGEFYLFIFC